MDFNLSEEQRLLSDNIVRFAQKELNDGLRERDRLQEFPHDLWLKCGEIGLQGLPVPEEYGGAGCDPLSVAIALEAFGYGCRDGGLVFAVCAHLLACVVPIWKHGNDEQKRAVAAPPLRRNSHRGERHDRAPDGLERFRHDDEGRSRRRRLPSQRNQDVQLQRSHCGRRARLRSHRRKEGLPRRRHGVSGREGDQGFSTGQKFEKLGLRTCPIGELVLEDVWVPANAVLGGVGSGSTIFTQSMDWERACLGASHLGTMRRLLEESIEHARTRSQYGQVDRQVPGDLAQNRRHEGAPRSVASSRLSRRFAPR